MNRKLITAVAVVTLGAAMAFAVPHEGFGGGRHGRGAFGEKLAQKLNLTDAQKQQVADIRKSTHEQNAAFFESARNTKKEYFAAKKANDSAKLESLKPAVEANRAQMKQIREAEMQKIASILTPEQKATWDKLKAEHAARHQHEQ